MFKLRRVENPEFGFDCVWQAAPEQRFCIYFFWATGKASMRDKREGLVMYQSKEKIQTVVLLLADLICFVISYFGGGYLWLVLYRERVRAEHESELTAQLWHRACTSHTLILLFSYLEKNFIRRNLARRLPGGVEASVIHDFCAGLVLTIFLQHNNADASRGVYFCIAGMNLVLFFVAHAAIKYYLLHIYRNKRGTNQLFLVTTTDRVKDTLAEIENAKRLGAP